MMRYSEAELDAMPVGTVLHAARLGDTEFALKRAQGCTCDWHYFEYESADFMTALEISAIDFTHRADPQPIQPAEDGVK